MKTSFNHKRSYHPLLIVLFHLQLLDAKTLRQIPFSTRAYWKNTEQENQFGYEEVKDYIEAQMDIRAVYTSKIVFRFCRFVCRMHDGYVRMQVYFSERKSSIEKFRHTLIETVTHLSQQVSVSIAARLMNISTQKYYRLKSQSQCKISKIKKCFRSFANQLSFREISAINKAVNDPDNFSKTKVSVYYLLLVAGKISCSLATFYKYCSDELKRTIKPKPVHESLRADRLFQYLHVDITELICLNGKVLVAFVKDNFSKAILGWKILPDKSSLHIRILFEKVFDRFQLHLHPERISIVSDGGSENNGELLIWIAQFVVPEVKKLTAGIEVKSNSMSESVHHILKGEYLRYQPPADPYQALVRFENYYNEERYPTEHFGYTCLEVLNGAVPDKNRFKLQLIEGRKKRIEENKNFFCLKEIICKKD